MKATALRLLGAIVVTGTLIWSASATDGRAASVVVTWNPSLENPPTIVLTNLTNVVGIAAGDYYSPLLMDDGNISLLWAGRVVSLPLGTTDVVAVAAEDIDLALRSDGTVMTWWSDDAGFHTMTVPGWSNVVSIAVGWRHALALESDGTVAEWRYGGYIQTNIYTGLSNMVAIAADCQGLALRSDGTVVAWGTNSLGQTQTNVPAGLSNVVAIAAGANSYALKGDETITAWGSGNIPIRSLVPPGLSNVVAIAARGTYPLALKADGTVVSWFGTSIVPAVPPGLSNVQAIATSLGYCLALVGKGPPQLHAPLINPTWDPTGFSVSLPTQSGRVYRLEYKSSLAEDNWTALPLVAGNGATRTLTDATATGAQRFYRVRQW